MGHRRKAVRTRPRAGANEGIRRKAELEGRIRRGAGAESQREGLFAEEPFTVERRSRCYARREYVLAESTETGERLLAKGIRLRQ